MINALTFSLFKTLTPWEFPGGPVVKTLPSNAGGEGLIPGQGSRSHMLQLEFECHKTPHSTEKIEDPACHN